MSRVETWQSPVIALVVKTNQGAMWVIPQIEALLAEGNSVVAIIPAGPGRLRTALDAVALENSEFAVDAINYDFSIRPRIATLRGIFELRKVFKRRRVRVAFYHLYASALVCRAATVFTRIRTVHMVAGPLYLENRTIRFFERFLHLRDDRIIAGSQYTYDKYREIGASAKKLSVVPYGVDLIRFDPEAVGAGDLGLDIVNDVKKFTVVMVAYFYAPKQLVFSSVGIKGHELAIEAWQKFATGKENVRLIFVGSGFGHDGDSYRERLRETSIEMGLEDSILWVDTVEDVRSLYKCADLSISPSLSDNHGAILEASAMAVPSIVSNAGALSEAVTEQSGWVFPSGDASELHRNIEGAYRLWKAQALANRGVAAREDMKARFDLNASALSIAETIKGQVRAADRKTR